MRSLLSFCVALSILCSFTFAQQSTAAYTTPAFFWSNTDYFVGQNEQVVEMTSLLNIKGAFMKSSSVMIENMKVNPKAAAPEVIAVFIQPELKTEQVSMLSDAYKIQPNGGALSNLKRLVETSKSSVVLPYAFSADESSIGTNLASALIEQSNGKIIIVNENGRSVPLGSSKASKMSLEEFLSALTSKNGMEILSNGVTDFVIIYMDAPAAQVNAEARDRYEADDELIAKICSLFKTSSYVAVFTADRTVRTHMKRFPSTHELLSDFEKRYEQTVVHSNNMWPEPIVEALLVMIPFLIVLLIGVYCSFGLQSALKFDAEKPKKL